jgi:hypothetical protein
MEEKKMTDEEIVKALEMHVNSDGKYSFEEWDRCKTVTQSDILDLIHRLQSENAEQKAEIERLTKRLDVCSEQLYHSCIDKGELQKQVDELKERCEIAEGTKRRLTIFDRIEIHDKAVKDTAKEICLKIIKDLPKPMQEKWMEFFRNEYGVEVE